MAGIDDLTSENSILRRKLKREREARVRIHRELCAALRALETLDSLQTNSLTHKATAAVSRLCNLEEELLKQPIEYSNTEHSLQKQIIRWKEKCLELQSESKKMHEEFAFRGEQTKKALEEMKTELQRLQQEKAAQDIEKTTKGQLQAKIADLEAQLAKEKELRTAAVQSKRDSDEQNRRLVQLLNKLEKERQEQLVHQEKLEEEQLELRESLDRALATLQVLRTSRGKQEPTFPNSRPHDSSAQPASRPSSVSTGSL